MINNGARKKVGKRYREGQGVRSCVGILNRMVREGGEGEGRGACGCLGKSIPGRGKQHVQQPWGEGLSALFPEQLGGQDG